MSKNKLRDSREDGQLLKKIIYNYERSCICPLAKHDLEVSEFRIDNRPPMGNSIKPDQFR